MVELLRYCCVFPPAAEITIVGHHTLPGNTRRSSSCGHIWIPLKDLGYDLPQVFEIFNRGGIAEENVVRRLSSFMPELEGKGKGGRAERGMVSYK